MVYLTYHRVKINITGLGQGPWTNRFTSASTTIVKGSSKSHMDVTNFHHQTKQRLPVYRNVSLFFRVPKIATVRLAVEVLNCTQQSINPGPSW